MVSVKALQLQQHMNNLICGICARNSSSIKDSRVKKHFCSSSASTSQPGEFMSSWLLSSSPRIYRTPAFLSSLLSSVLQRNYSFCWKTAKNCERCHTATVGLWTELDDTVKNIKYSKDCYCSGINTVFYIFSLLKTFLLESIMRGTCIIFVERLFMLFVWYFRFILQFTVKSFDFEWFVFVSQVSHLLSQSLCVTAKHKELGISHKIWHSHSCKHFWFVIMQNNPIDPSISLI